MADETEGATIGDLAGLLISDTKNPGGNPADGERADQNSDADDLAAAGEDGNLDGVDDAVGTDPEAGEGDAEDEQSERAPPDDGNPEPLYTVKIDGKEKQVTLKEALSGYQRSEDYTRKTQALADERSGVVAERTAYQEQRAAYEQILQSLQGRLGPADQEPTQEQWDKLRVDNPDAYAVEYADFQRRQSARENIRKEQERVARERNSEAVVAVKDFIGQQRSKLLEKMPEWKDQKKYEAGAKLVFDFAKDQYGFSDAELKQAVDHRMILMADDARKYRAIVAARAKVNGKVAGAAVMPEPGARQPAVSRKVVVRKEAQKQFDRSGKIDDAVPLMFK